MLKIVFPNEKVFNRVSRALRVTGIEMLYAAVIGCWYTVGRSDGIKQGIKTSAHFFDTYTQELVDSGHVTYAQLNEALDKVRQKVKEGKNESNN